MAPSTTLPASIALLLAAGLLALAGPASKTVAKNSTSESFRNSFFSHLAGLKVENRDGQPIGRVSDCVIDMQTGQVDYAIITGGGWLGWGRRSKVVPGGTLTAATSKKGVLGLALTRRQWQQSPVVRSTQPADIERAVRGSHFARLATTSPSNLTSTGRTNTSARTFSASHQYFQVASDLLGKWVVSGQGEKLGEVSDLIVDLSDGKTAFAVLTRKHLLKTERFALPVRSLLRIPDGKLVIDVSEPEFAHAPVFNDPVWENTSSAPSAVVFRLSHQKKAQAGKFPESISVRFRYSDRTPISTG